MKTEEEKPFKPVPKRSKFAKPNNNGQVPKNCINFNFTGKHCQYSKDLNDINSEVIETDCKVLSGEFCKRYVYVLKTDGIFKYLTLSIRI